MNNVPFQTKTLPTTQSRLAQGILLWAFYHMLYQFYLFTAINRNGLEADSKLYNIYANSGIWTWSNLKSIHGSTDEFVCRLIWQWIESKHSVFYSFKLFKIIGWIIKYYAAFTNILKY